MQWLRLCAPNAGGLGSTPGWGTRSHMHTTVNILWVAASKTQCSLNKYFLKWQNQVGFQEKDFILFHFLDAKEIKFKIQFLSGTSHIGLGATVLNSAGLGFLQWHFHILRLERVPRSFEWVWMLYLLREFVFLSSIKGDKGWQRWS